MLSPDICNFKYHHLHQTYTKCQLDSQVLNNFIMKHSFNHSVCAIFPDTLNVPSNINECLSRDMVYYNIGNVSISEFCDHLFIEAFVKGGELTALSIDTLLDIDNCAAITPSGILVLSLDRDTFQQLGIDRGPTVDLVKQIFGDKYQLQIDLKHTSFKPGKKNYERISSQLKKLKQLNLNFILSWEPSRDSVCPSSIASYFNKRGYTIEECQPNIIKRIDYNVRIPIDKDAEPEELFEWFGLHVLEAKEFSDPIHQEFLSSYRGVDNMEMIGQVTFIQCTGLFTTKKISKLLNMLRNHITEKPNIPFIGMHVQGFDDAPLTWGNNVNNYLNSGENNYSFIIFSKENVITMKTFV